ncbi:MAG: hypothetical protein ACKOFP_04740, partial [Actinomycetota bacterium]
GVHVHVGVRSGDKAIATVNSLTGYLPIFLALRVARDETPKAARERLGCRVDGIHANSLPGDGD